MPELNAYQPIRTKYDGILFRSRLEARWAVAFDVAGIDYLYEMEGFELPSGNYLPDFWLPQVKMWAEVKPADFTREELRKCHQLAVHTGFNCLMLNGIPSAINYWAALAKPTELLPDQKHTAADWFTDYLIFHYKKYHLCEGRFYCDTGAELGQQSEEDQLMEPILAARKYRFWDPS